jgi:hypothetical protein
MISLHFGAGTIDDSDNSIVEEFQTVSNTEFPDQPRSDNEYTLGVPSPFDPDEFFTGFDECVPDDLNSIPKPLEDYNIILTAPPPSFFLP